MRGVVARQEHAVHVHRKVIASDVMGGNVGQGMTHVGSTDVPPRGSFREPGKEALLHALKRVFVRTEQRGHHQMLAVGARVQKGRHVHVKHG